MRNPRFPLLAIVAYLALAGLLAISTARPGSTQAGHPPGPDVRVVNTTAEPVPVTLQSPNPVPVTLQGSATIDTTNPIPVRDVDRQPQQPVQFSLFIPGPSSYTVPAGKRLVVEYVSGGFVIIPHGGVAATVGLEVRPGFDGHVFAGVPSSYNDGAPAPDGLGFTFSQSARLYAGPGKSLSLGGGGVQLASMRVSGYLVDVP